MNNRGERYLESCLRGYKRASANPHIPESVQKAYAVMVRDLEVVRAMNTGEYTGTDWGREYGPDTKTGTWTLRDEPCNG